MAIIPGGGMERISLAVEFALMLRISEGEAGRYLKKKHRG